MALSIGSAHIKNLMLGTTQIQKVYLGTLLVWQNEVISTLANTSNVILKNLFTPDVWNNPNTKKRVVVPAGVVIGATLLSHAMAISVEADGQAGSFAGELIIDIHGSVRGIGGAANGGVGGNAFSGNLRGKAGQKAIVNLHPGGELKAGGGGAGRGGQGGPGVWYSGRTVTEGPYWDQNYYTYNIIEDSANSRGALWAGRSIPPGELHEYSPIQFMKTEVYDYRWQYWSIRRTYTVYDVPNYTVGGPGGNGGRGEGFDGSASAGAPGSAGGTNAGPGGAGNTGGGYGQPGGAGAPGGAGNNGAGAAGQAGGLAGSYVAGNDNITFNNLGGTVAGRLI